MGFFRRIQERVGNSRGKRAIGVRTVERLPYIDLLSKQLFIPN